MLTKIGQRKGRTHYHWSPDPMSTFAKTLRSDLAVNPHHDDESLMRCTCDACVRDAGETLRTLYRKIADAVPYLPLMEGAAPLSVERFQMALHRLHVYVTPAGAPTT